MRRECIRQEAAERFGRGDKTAQIAKDLRVSVRSVERWRRAWREGGMKALSTRGPTRRPRLRADQFAVLEAELTQGPSAHGWEDQRWTLPRIKTVIGRRFHISWYFPRWSDRWS